jgi:hypothetical protein
MLPRALEKCKKSRKVMLKPKPKEGSCHAALLIFLPVKKQGQALQNGKAAH